MEFGCRFVHYIRSYELRVSPRFSLYPSLSRRNFIENARGQSSDMKQCCQQEQNAVCLPGKSSQLTGGVVALGKFDALHTGHRELARHASEVGTPYLLSFVGMAEILGWEPRAPIVAQYDRKRILSSWASHCGNVVPVEFHIQFSTVRHLSPRQFIEYLSKELNVSGVVAGENYRFGYKASGDSSELVNLCKEYGLGAYIVDFVMDRRKVPLHMPLTTNGEKGQVSSTQVRHALAMGDVEYASELLGRAHSLVLAVGPGFIDSKRELLIPKSCSLNLPPKEGIYRGCHTVACNTVLGQCTVTIDRTYVHIELNNSISSSWNMSDDYQTLSIFFGNNC